MTSKYPTTNVKVELVLKCPKYECGGDAVHW